MRYKIIFRNTPGLNLMANMKFSNCGILVYFNKKFNIIKLYIIIFEILFFIKNLEYL